MKFIFFNDRIVQLNDNTFRNSSHHYGLSHFGLPLRSILYSVSYHHFACHSTKEHATSPLQHTLKPLSSSPQYLFSQTHLQSSVHLQVILDLPLLPSVMCKSIEIFMLVDFARKMWFIYLHKMKLIYLLYIVKFEWSSSRRFQSSKPSVYSWWTHASSITSWAQFR